MEDNQTFVATDKNWIPWEDAKCEDSTYTNPQDVQAADNESTTNIFSTSAAEKHQVECNDKFGDSLHQLNKIVERISPDSSAANYQNFSTSFGNKIHNLNSRLRSSYGSSYTDSITDSAYETCVGDNSFDCPNDEQYMSHLRDQIDIYDSRNMRSWPPPPQQQQQPPNEWNPDMRSMPMKVQPPLSLSLCAKDIYNSNTSNNFHISNSLSVNDDNDFSVCNMDKSYKLQNMDKDYSILTSQNKMLYSPDKPPLKKSKPLSEQQHHSVGTPTLQNQHHHQQHHHHHSVEDSHILYESDASKQLEWAHHHQNSTSYLELDKYNDHHMESNMTSFDKNIIGKNYSRCTNSVDNDNNTGNNINNTILSAESKDANLSDCNMNADSRNSSDDEDGRCDNDGSGKQIFTCTHCNFGARKKGQLRKHMSMHGIFLCAHCEFSSEIADVLEDHRKVSHPGLCGRKLCKKCRVLYQGDELEEHERLCSGEKQNWICPICQKEFKFLSVMKAHARKWHPNETNALMSSSNVMMTPGLQMECSWRTSAADSTTGEMTPENENSNRARSNSDEYLSSSDNHNSYYGGHPNNKMMDMKQHADNSYNMYCKPDKLKKPYIQMESKKYMSNMNVGGRGENCGDPCSNEDGPPLELAFYCDHENCCTTFRSDKELNVHRMSIHGMPPKRYHCRHPDCSMQFAKFGHYKRHQLSHAGGGEKKFRCDWPNCGKAFCHTDNLKVHYRRHTDEKPYKCDKCASSYRQKSGLKYHLEKAHDEKSTGKPGRKRKNLLPNLSAESPDYSMLSNKYDAQEGAYKKSMPDARRSQQQHSNSQVGYDSSGFSSPCLSTGNKGNKHSSGSNNRNNNNNNNSVNNDDDLNNNNNNNMSYHSYYNNHSHEELKSMQKHKLVDESNHHQSHHQHQQQHHHPHQQQQHMHSWNTKSFSPPGDMMISANSLYGKPPPGFMGMSMERPPPMDHSQMYSLKMDRHLNSNQQQQQQPNYYTDDKGSSNSSSNNNNSSSNSMYCDQTKQSDMSMRFIGEHSNSIESSHHMFNMSPNMPKQLHHSRNEDHWASYQQHHQHEIKSLKHMDKFMACYPRSDKNTLLSNYGDDEDDDDDDNDNSNDEEQYDNCNNNNSSRNDINNGNINRINNSNDDENDDNIDNNVNNNNSNGSVELPSMNISNNHDAERDDESENLGSRERIGGLPLPNSFMDDKVRMDSGVLERDGDESERGGTFASENEQQSKFPMLRNVEEEEDEENGDVRNLNSTKANADENNEDAEDGDGVGNDSKGSSASARNSTPIIASLERVKKESFNDDNDYSGERDDRGNEEDHDRNDNEDGDDDDRAANKDSSSDNRNQGNDDEEEEDANKTWANNETSPNAESQPLSSTSMAKGWPRILDASLTESNNSFNPLDPTKNIFGSSVESATPETGGLFKPLDSSRIRSVDPIPGFGMFGMTQSYQPANDYPIPAPPLTSRPPIINDNYYLGSQPSNLPYGNMYNFPRRHPANQLESPFNSFQSPDRYGRPTESEYRDQTLRLGSTYGFLHSSPYPYDHRPYGNTQEASSSFMPSGYDFSYAPSALPPFPPPPTFSLTRPWAGPSNELDLFPGVDSSKTQRSSYQSSPYGGAQSSSTNRYF